MCQRKVLFASTGIILLLGDVGTKKTELKEDSGFLFPERDNKLSEIRLLTFPLGTQRWLPL